MSGANSRSASAKASLVSATRVTPGTPARSSARLTKWRGTRNWGAAPQRGGSLSNSQ